MKKLHNGNHFLILLVVLLMVFLHFPTGIAAEGENYDPNQVHFQWLDESDTSINLMDSSPYQLTAIPTVDGKEVDEPVHWEIYDVYSYRTYEYDSSIFDLTQDGVVTALDYGTASVRAYLDNM